MQKALRLPDPEVIRKTAEEVIQSPEYQLEPATGDPTFILAMLFRILRWLATPFIWLLDLMEGLPTVLQWIVVIAAVVILVAIIVHIVYTFVVAFRGPRRKLGFELSDPVEHLSPEGLETLAEVALEQHDYISAVRHLFRACMLRLELYEQKSVRLGLTNREYLRRYQKTQAFQPVKQFVEVIDVKWYGAGECTLEDFESCRQAHSEIRHLINGV
jgi:hypothetical protein